MTTLSEALKTKIQKESFPPTEEQQAILNSVQTIFREDGVATLGPRVIAVQAGAGTGKSTTLAFIAKLLHDKVGQYTAFNRGLVDDTREKFAGTKCRCHTTHQLGFHFGPGKEYAERLGGRRVRAYEVANILGIKPYQLPPATKEEKEGKTLHPAFLASRIRRALERFSQSADKKIEIRHFARIDGIDTPGESTNNDKIKRKLLPYAKRYWEDVRDLRGQLPFSHDFYVKMWQLSGADIPCDYILLDEAQDTAPVMLDIMEQQVKKGTPLILVGDSAQQIYEWRGAINAMTHFKDAPELLLSQSFRFGQPVADIANAILDGLQKSTSLRLKGFDKIPCRVGVVKKSEAILCRTNALAVAQFLGAIAEGERPYLVGGGSQVISFMEAVIKLQSGEEVTHPELACFKDWNEVVEYAESEEGEDLKLMVKLIQQFGAATILEGIKQMPKEKEATLTISTAHKSKGREWSSVKISGDFPGRKESNDADLKLLYVAVTRAKNELDVTECPYFLGGEGLDVSAIIGRQAVPEDIAKLAKEKEEAKKQEQNQNPEFTWSKLQNGSWGIRGPKGHAKEKVTVTRKDGSESIVSLGEVYRELGNDTTLYHKV